MLEWDELGTRIQEWRGRWWLPTKPNEAVAGELRLAADQFKLVLDGALSGHPPRTPPDGIIHDFFVPVEEPIILGESRDGERLTLLDCDGWVSQIPDGTVHVSEWQPTAALVGDHLTSKEELTFVSVEGAFDYLLDWVGLSSLRYSFSLEHKTGRTAKISIDAERQVLERVAVDGADAELSIFPSWHVGGPRAEIQINASLKFELHQSTDWRTAFHKWIAVARDLVSFATLRANQVDWIRLRNDRPPRPTSVMLVLQLLDLDRPPRSEKSLTAREMLFTAADIPGGMELGLQRWFKLRATYESVFLPMLGAGYAPFTYDNHRFLDFTQAAEILHRFTVGGSPLPGEEHRERVKTVVEQVSDPDLRAWASSVLAQSNWHPLRDRLRALVAGLGPLGSEIVDHDPDLFVRRVVGTRNYLTHRSGKPSALLEGADRYWHGQALLWIVRGWLLRELGFSEDRANSIVRSNISYARFRQNYSA